MTANGIPLDKAELLSMVMEALLYGFSLPLFGGTIWALTSRRPASQINSKVVTVACLLLLCSTVHFVICTIRTINGLIVSRNAFPRDPIAYFSDVSEWTFVSKNYVYTAQTLIGDGVVLYRCYVVWRSKLIMILPVLLWCAVLVTGIAAPYAELYGRPNEVFQGSISLWITSFWASTLVTNLFTTLLLAYRIWRIDCNTTGPLSTQRSQLRPILYIVLDAGVIYSLTLLAALVCFVNRSNGQYVILDMITPIISITFYMVIIRVGIATQVKRPRNSHVPYTTTANSVNVDRRSRAQVITTLIDVDNSWHWQSSPRVSVAVESNDQSESKVDDVTGEV